MQSLQQFITYFLPSKYNYEIVASPTKSDITVWDIYANNNTNLQDDEINILICVENADHWNFYGHYKTYGNYGDNKMHIYLYNHIDRIEQNNYLSLPTVHFYINYYLNSVEGPTSPTTFAQKRFCLVINKSNMNPEISQMQKELEQIDVVDHIRIHTNIENDSCYHSVELLNVFNQYKFIICYENSYKNGYVTEKIFNCFLAKTLPIYKGAPNVKEYFNEGSFIDARNETCIELIKTLNNDAELYNTYIQSEKISKLYDNENYNDKMVKFIEDRLDHT
jgi:hypothetical protein